MDKNINSLAKKINKNIVDPKKLQDAFLVDKNDAECWLIITEGDSARSFVIDGMTGK